MNNQEKLFTVEESWNDRYPCPVCGEPKALKFSTTEGMSYVSCFKCHHTWRREEDATE